MTQCFASKRLIYSGIFFDYAARGRSRSLEIEIGQRLLFRRPAPDGFDAEMPDAVTAWEAQHKIMAPALILWRDVFDHFDVAPSCAAAVQEMREQAGEVARAAND